MTDLRNLQERLQNYLLKGQTDIQTAIVSTDKVPTAQRLAIYLDAYRTRLIEALASNYPILQRHLGEENFHQLGEAYLANHPSSYRSIRWFGEHLAPYLTSHVNPEYPYLSELAQFEWQMTLTFDAADVQVISIEEMAAVPAEAWAKMRLFPHPSLQRLNLFWNVVPLWQALANEQPFEKNELIKNDKPLPWLIWRNGYTIQFYALSEEEAWAIDAMLNGLSFGELCTGLCAWMDEQDVGMRAASLLKGWIQSNKVATINYE